MESFYSAPYSFALLRRFKLVNLFYHSEPALRYFTLLGASIALSVVSFYTTFQGFQALTNSYSGAVALALAVQLALFWTARELGRRGSNWKEILIFLISMLLSVSFSYTYIADKLDIQGGAGSKLMLQIDQALHNVDSAKRAVMQVAERAESSARRWEDMKIQEIALGRSTPFFRGPGPGGLSSTYEGYRGMNIEGSVRAKAMLPNLNKAEEELKAARATFEKSKIFTEYSLAQLRSAVADAKDAFKPTVLSGVLESIRVQEDAIYDEFFKPFEGTKREKAFKRFSDGKPEIPSNPFVGLTISSLESDYNRAIRNALGLVRDPTLEMALAFILASGLDFMILLCAFATNFGIPLRVIPNQEMDVDALLRAKALELGFPQFMQEVTRRGRKIIADLDLEKMSVGEKLPFLNLLEKKKVIQRNGGFELAPDLVDYILRSVYVEATKNQVVRQMEGDPEIDRLIPLAVLRRGQMMISAKEAETAGWEGLALLDLVDRGLLKRSRHLNGDVRYIFTAEMIDCCQRLRNGRPPGAPVTVPKKVA